MAFSRFLMNKISAGPTWYPRVEDTIDGIDQFSGDILLFSASEIGWRERGITQGYECMHASHEDIGVRLAVRGYAGQLVVRPSSQVSSLREMDSEIMSMASTLA
jgi:hypothetical protein